MKRLVVLAALLVIAAVPAMAQSNYHYNQNMNCSDCHSMHASAHNNLTDGSAIETPNTTPGTAINPYYPGQPSNGRHYLLKADDVCETCHKDQTWAPDVFGDNVNGYIRSAGGVREDATGGGHKMGSTVAAPGYQGTVINYFPAGKELECVTCHSPHGGTNFRNLTPYQMRNTAGYLAANMGVTQSKNAAFQTGTDVTILGGDSYVFGSGTMQNYYGRDKIAYAKLATPIVYNGATSSNRMDQFCGICHGAFHGGSVSDSTTVSDGTGFIKHPTGVVTVASAGGTFGGAGKGASTLKVYQAAGTIDPATDTPGCVTCHKAHGNNNPFALIYPDRATGTVPNEQGGGVYKDLCKTCHQMGGA